MCYVLCELCIGAIFDPYFTQNVPVTLNLYVAYLNEEESVSISDVSKVLLNGWILLGSSLMSFVCSSQVICCHLGITDNISMLHISFDVNLHIRMENGKRITIFNSRITCVDTFAFHFSSSVKIFGF